MQEEAYPKKPLHGRTSKIHRYYWREIHVETIRQFAAWAKEQGYNDWLIASVKQREKHDCIERDVVAHIKEQHAISPKYHYHDKSQSEVLKEHGVTVTKLRGSHEHRNGKAVIHDGNRFLCPEEFVGEDLKRRGYSYLITESVPFHALFGVFMWVLIEDPGDPRNRLVSFGNRDAFERKETGQMVRMYLPEDFGRSGYYARRREAIDEHLRTLRVKRRELLGLFDYWKSDEYSGRLRHYLWAHRTESVDTARRVAEILPVDVVVGILEFLVQDYWGRYLGWPDLLVCRGDEFSFIEVKSSKDKMSEDQKTWIALNAMHLKLPFGMVKIHNTGSMSKEALI